MATQDDYADAAEATPRLAADDEATAAAPGEKAKATDKAKVRRQTGATTPTQAASSLAEEGLVRAMLGGPQAPATAPAELDLVLGPNAAARG